MGGGLESRCVGHVCGEDDTVARHHPHINKITLLHQICISNYFMRKVHGQTTLIFVDLLFWCI